MFCYSTAHFHFLWTYGFHVCMIIETDMQIVHSLMYFPLHLLSFQSLGPPWPLRRTSWGWTSRRPATSSLGGCRRSPQTRPRTTPLPRRPGRRPSFWTRCVDTIPNWHGGGGGKSGSVCVRVQQASNKQNWCSVHPCLHSGKCAVFLQLICFCCLSSAAHLFKLILPSIPPRATLTRTPPIYYVSLQHLFD